MFGMSELLGVKSGAMFCELHCRSCRSACERINSSMDMREKSLAWGWACSEILAHPMSSWTQERPTRLFKETL